MNVSDDGEHDTELDSGDEHHTFRASNDGIETDGKLPWEHDEPDYPYGDWNDTLHTHQSYINS